MNELQSARIAMYASRDLRRRWHTGASARAQAGVLALLLVLPCSAGSFGLGDLFGGGAGGMIVYDPTNHLETAVSAAEAVRQTALQVRAEIQRLQQLGIELRQLQALPEDTVRSVLADWRGQLGALDTLGSELGGLAEELARIRQRAGVRLDAVGALGKAPQDTLEREHAVGQQHARSFAAVFSVERQSLASLAGASRTLSRLQAAIPASTGLQQSLQTTNAYLDLLAGQTAQLLQVTATQAAAAAAQKEGEAQDASLADAREATRLQQDLQTIGSLRRRLRAQEAQQGWGVLQPLP